MAGFDQLSIVPEAMWVLMAKTAGAVSGSAISIAYMLPKNRREAAIRFAAGMLIGMIFGTPTGLHLTNLLGIRGDIGTVETIMIGSASASLCAWWGLGMLARLARTYTPVR